MDAVWINFLYHPLIPLGILLAALSVLAFLVFLRGFLSGALYLITLNGNDDFNKHARIRVFWGFLLLVFFFSLWQMLQWVGALFTGTPSPPGRFSAHVLLVLLGLAIWGAKYLKKNTAV
jgi:hypothetical protein